MTFEEVLSDNDSEDEVDDDIADLEDRRVRCGYLIIFLAEHRLSSSSTLP
jgi:hypothetical protein